jgi:hypothetical protein
MTSQKTFWHIVFICRIWVLIIDVSLIEWLQNLSQLSFNKTFIIDDNVPYGILVLLRYLNLHYNDHIKLFQLFGNKC